MRVCGSIVEILERAHAMLFPFSDVQRRVPDGHTKFSLFFFSVTVKLALPEPSGISPHVQKPREVRISTAGTGARHGITTAARGDGDGERDDGLRVEYIQHLPYSGNARYQNTTIFVRAPKVEYRGSTRGSTRKIYYTYSTPSTIVGQGMTIRARS